MSGVVKFAVCAMSLPDTADIASEQGVLEDTDAMIRRGSRESCDEFRWEVQGTALLFVTEGDGAFLTGKDADRHSWTAGDVKVILPPSLCLDIKV